MMPYFDALLRMIDGGQDNDVSRAFGKHVHWGYWDEPPLTEVTAGEYARAANDMVKFVWQTGSRGSCRDVADIGCGLGGTIATLNELLRETTLVGVNIDDRQLEVARQKVIARAGNRIAFIHGDACQLPFAEQSFDAVMAVESIFHFPNRLRFFQQAQRVLRTPGTLIVSDFVPVSGTAALLKFLSRFQRNLIEHSYGQVDVFCPLWQYRRIARQSGFTMTKTQDITGNTLPTYRFLKVLNKVWGDQLEAESFAKATALLERLTQAGILRYIIMVYQK